MSSPAEHGHGHGGERMQVVAASGGPLSAVTTTREDHELSEFPALVSPDRRSLLVLRSQPAAEGQTIDRLGLLELDRLPGAVKEIGPQAQLRNPCWSPDGQWIVYESDANSFRDLYRLELSDSAPVGELRLTDNPEGNFEPSIAPDAQRIVFVSSRDGDAEVYVMTADGGAPTRLTNSPGDDTAPVWSPDGQSIAFTSARDRARGIDVYLMNLDGSEQRPAVREREGSVIAQDLTFSPTGKQLAFTELQPTRGASIVIVEVETGAVVARSEAGGVDEQPSWSDDGLFVAFARHRGEISDIAWMRADGSETQVLTDGAGVHWLPRWVSDAQCPRVPAPVQPTPSQG